MLYRDDELRLSEEVQEKYAMEPDSWAWKWQVTEEVQQRVCREFGFEESGAGLAEGLDLLRSAIALFPEDEGIRQAAHYLRHNIHMECPISVGKVVPDIPLFSLAGGERSLSQVVAAGRPGATVIFAGSHT